MVVTDKDIDQFLNILRSISKEYTQFKHTSLTKDFIKEHDISYYHAQAIMERKLLEMRKMFGNARMKEYRWAAGEPTKVMAREVLELTEQLKSGSKSKPLEYELKNKIDDIRSALILTGSNELLGLTNKELETIVQLVDYFSDKEWDAKFHEIMEIITKMQKDETPKD